MCAEYTYASTVCVCVCVCVCACVRVWIIHVHACIQIFTLTNDVLKHFNYMRML